MSFPTKYYHVVGLGSSETDSIVLLPHPTAIFQLHDTAHTSLIVRFPNLGLLSNIEDTLTKPSAMFPDTMVTFQSKDPLCHLISPKTPYGIFVQVVDKQTHKVLDNRMLPYDMDVLKFKARPLVFKHAPTSGYDNKTLRRKFFPRLLPLVLQTNPGWIGIETLDTAGTYSLDFRDPSDTSKIVLSIVMRAANVGKLGKTDWEKFKRHAQEAYGMKGVAVSNVGDFELDDKPSRKLISKCYEFISKRTPVTFNYVATYLTPQAIFLLTAPLDEGETELSYAYFRAVARSLRVSSRN